MHDRVIFKYYKLYHSINKVNLDSVFFANKTISNYCFKTESL